MIRYSYMVYGQILQAPLSQDVLHYLAYGERYVEVHASGFCMIHEAESTRLFRGELFTNNNCISCLRMIVIHDAGHPLSAPTSFSIIKIAQFIVICL